MKKLLIIGLFIKSLFAGDQAYNQLIFYERAGFVGKEYIFTMSAGVSKDLSRWGRDFSSLKIGNGIKNGRIYNGNGLTYFRIEDVVTHGNSLYDFATQASWLNDNAESAIVWNIEKPPAPEIQFDRNKQMVCYYTGFDYTGTEVCYQLTNSEQVFKINYVSDSYNDKFKSLRVGTNVKVRGYEDRDFIGQYFTRIKDDSHFPDVMKDKISSLIVISSNGNFDTNTLTSSFTRIKSQNNYCLEIADSNNAKNSNIQLNSCIGSDNQKWELTSQGLLKSKLNNMCLDVAGGSAVNGARVTMWDCHGEDNQKWKIENQQIKSNLTNDFCLDNTSLDKNAEVLMWPCHDGSIQKWVQSN